jgi:MFS family permease
MAAAAEGEQSNNEGDAGSPMGRAFLALCLIAFLNSFITSPFSSLFPVYIEADLGRAPLFTGYLKAVMLALGGIFAVIGGRLCDTWGLKATLLIGLAGSLFSGLVLRWEDTYMLTLLILCIGLAGGCWSTAGQGYLIASVESQRLGLGSAFYFLSNTAGNSLGSLATGLVKERWDFPQIGLAMTLGVAALFVLGIAILPGGKQAKSTPTARQPLALWSAYKPLLRQPNVHLFIAMRYSITSFWGMVGLVMPLLVYRVSDSEAMAAYYAAVSLAVAAVGQLFTGYMRDRYGQFWPFLIAASGVALSALCLVLFWHSLTGLFIFGTALTTMAWAVSTLLPGMINEVAGPEEKNRMVGLGHMVWSAAMVSGSLIGGVLLEIDPAVPFLVGVGLATIGTVCGWRLCLRLQPVQIR